MELGEEAHFINLMKEKECQDSKIILEIINQFNPNLIISGLSTLQQEWPFIYNSKLLGIPTIAVLDIGVGCKFKNIDPSQFPDQFLVTNSLSKNELINLGAKPSNISIAGSTFLESLTKLRPKLKFSTLDSYYKLKPYTSLIPFFCYPDTEKSIKAIESIARIILDAQVDNPILIIRPHPRSIKKFLLEKICLQFEHLRYDEGEAFNNENLLFYSKLSFSMVSTVSLESMVMGVPSAFYQYGWDYADSDEKYKNILDVIRIRDKKGMNNFVSRSLQRGNKLLSVSSRKLENNDGALERSWFVVEKFLKINQ